MNPDTISVQGALRRVLGEKQFQSEGRCMAWTGVVCVRGLERVWNSRRTVSHRILFLLLWCCGAANAEPVSSAEAEPDTGPQVENGRRGTAHLEAAIDSCALQLTAEEMQDLAGAFGTEVREVSQYYGPNRQAFGLLAKG